MDASGPLARRVGYVLKQAQSALHARMEAALHPHGLGVTPYACLELLGQEPGLSNAELARRAFVTRQAMNVVLRDLQRDGLVHRPAEARTGRVLPATLTEAGRERLDRARDAVAQVERAMVATLGAEQSDALLAHLQAVSAALRAGRPR